MRRIWQAFVAWIDEGEKEYARTQRRRVEVEAAALGGTVAWQDQTDDATIAAAIYRVAPWRSNFEDLQ